MEWLRLLEEARRQKEVEKDKDGGFRLEDLGRTELTRENIDRAWEMIAQKERSPKEVRKWKNLQLNHFETDIARYALVALAHHCRETLARQELQSGDPVASTPEGSPGSLLRFGDACWEDFVALQSNELRHLKTYPELLENQIRAYQALKGRFCNPSSTRPSPSEPSRHTHTTTESEGDSRVTHDHHESHNHRGERTQERELAKGAGEPAVDFGSTITIENVRRAFSVDPGNSFGIWETPMTDESELMGFAVYPRPSFFNHRECPFASLDGAPVRQLASARELSSFSCVWTDYPRTDCAPNVTKVRKGRGLGFVTTRQVETGEELCISYGHVEGMSLEERQKELSEGWFFNCRCSRCVSEAEASGRKLG